MEKETMIMGVAAPAVQAGPAATPVQQAPRARAPYEPPALQAVGLGPVFAEYVYLSDEGDNSDDNLTGDNLFGSGSGSDGE